MKNVYLCQAQYGIEQRKEITYYLPYSAGCLWSYVAQFDDIADNFCLRELIFKREPIDKVLDRIQDPEIFGFSCYVWNEKYCLALAKEVKAKWPGCLIVFGGPQVSGKMIGHDFIDVLVMAEGEEAFLEILRNNLAQRPQEKFYTKRRLENLDIPSPYATGVFDKILMENPNALWSMTLETNRGCPYACTFCDWGGTTYSKIKKFDLQRIQEDIEWIARWPVSYLLCADANFGILKDRDLEIAKMIKNVHGRSKLDSVNINYAKNSTELVFEIAKILGPLSRGVTVSVQSMHQDTLEAIKRGNMDVNNISKMIRLSQEYGVFTYTEVILGLPLETLETWKQGLADILEMGQHHNIDMWFGQLLENSELNSTAERMKYGIKSIVAKDYMNLYNPGDDHNIKEEIDLICETNTMSRDDMVEAYMYGWMIIHMHINGYSQMLARYCRHIHGVSYRSFYDKIFSKLQESDFFSAHFQRLRFIVSNYLSTGEMIDEKNIIKGGHTIHAASYEYFYNNQTHAKALALEVAKSFIEVPSSVVELHENFLFDPDKNYPVSLDLDFDIVSWQPGKNKYTIHPQISTNDKFDFYIMRRYGLIKNKIIREN